MAAYFKILSKTLRRQQEKYGTPRTEDLGLAELVGDPFHWDKSRRPRKNGTPRKPNPGYERGMRAEERFFAICASKKDAGEFPSWLIDVIRGSARADSVGIDAFARSSEGLLPIQIKSSFTGREKFRKHGNRRHIICIVVSDEQSDNEVFQMILEELESVRVAVS